MFRGEELGRKQTLAILDAMLAEYTSNGPEQRNELLLAGYLYQLLHTMTYAANIYLPHPYADERITRIIQYINVFLQGVQKRKGDIPHRVSAKTPIGRQRL